MNCFSLLVYETQPLTHGFIKNVIFSLYSSLILFLSTPELFAQGNDSSFLSLIDLNLYYTYSFSCHFIQVDNGSAVSFFIV